MQQNLLNENPKLNEIKKSICKIKKDENNVATGFFLRTKYNEKDIYLLVTAHHEIQYTLVENKKTKIEIIIDFENIKQEIILDNHERKIICLKEEDITAIEILDKDIIKNKVKFLKYDKKCTKHQIQNYSNIEAFIFHHPNGENLQCNKGKILEVGVPKVYEFRHNIYTQKGSSGSPILYIKKKSKKRPNSRLRVIGVHTSCDPQTKTNIGTFIYILTSQIKSGKHNIEYIHKLKIPTNVEALIPTGTKMYVKSLNSDINSTLIVNGGAHLILGSDD